MDEETELLIRLAANHLYLAQFEPLRAVLLTLRAKNPGLSRSFLQTIVANSGRFEKVLWSRACSTPTHLTYLSALELLQHDDACSLWSFGSDTLRLRVEFLLYVQILFDGVSDRIRSVPSTNEEKSEEFGHVSDELNRCRQVLGQLMELGVRRLKADVAKDGGSGNLGGDDREKTVVVSIGESELTCLREVVGQHADILDALCFNVKQQLQSCAVDDSGLALTLHRDEKMRINYVQEEEDAKVMGFILNRVQLCHLDAIKDCVDKNDEEGAINCLRYLHFDYNIKEEEYRMVLRDMVKMLLSSREGFSDTWHVVREKLLRVYEEALSSDSVHLVQMIELIQDDLLSEDIEKFRALDNKNIPPPLDNFKKLLYASKQHIGSSQKMLPAKTSITACLREMYHYARVCRLHVLECIMDTSLAAVKEQCIEEASNILMLFPQLQPLVAAMSWDLLHGNTTGRRNLMRLLCGSSSQVIHLEESSLYGSQSGETSCVEHLCDSLCYQLDLASFVACVNSGQPWDSKSSILLSVKEEIPFTDEDSCVDPFVENYVLERLSVQSPLRVLFDVVPGIKFPDAIKLINMQPIASNITTWKRVKDIELMHMRYALESIVLALGAMEKSSNEEKESYQHDAICHLKDLRNHLEAINDVPRKIYMVNVIISVLHMDALPFNLTHCSSPKSYSGSLNTSIWESTDTTAGEGGHQMVISFTGLLLETLRCNLLSTGYDQENFSGSESPSGRQALDWRISIAKHFIEDWEWRLSILQRLLPLYECQWRWREALIVLRATPSKLLNLCLQRAKYDIGKEAIHRFALSAEDKAILELTEWVDRTCGKMEDVVSCAADGTSIHALDFASLRSKLGPLAATLLCIDVAASSAKPAQMCQQLLNQAQAILSEIYPGGPPKSGPSYWDQIHDVGIIYVSRRVLKRCHDFLEQDNPPALHAILSGEIVMSSSKESQRQGQRERALALLHQMVDDAHKGKRQFLSGKLHNLARAISDEETEHDSSRRDFINADHKGFIQDSNHFHGIGLRAVKQTAMISGSGENNSELTDYDVKESGKRYIGSLTSKPTTYLSQFILHIAAIGDIVDGTDTTHDFNFFSVVYEWPKDLLTRLVFDRGNTDAAGKVAEIMHADFVHEAISACVPPVYPPRSGRGWACIPIIHGSSKNLSENKVLSPSSKEAKPGSYSCSSSTPGFPLYPLELDLVKHLVKISPVRAILACVFGSSILYSGSDSSISSSLNNGLLQTTDTDHMFYEFALDQSERFPTLNRWIQTQTNLHRVTEFAVMSLQKYDGGGRGEHEARNAIKRSHVPDSDTESELDDNNANSSISATLVDHHGEMIEHCGGFPKSEYTYLGPTAFLSFDWENEEPYERAVDKLIDEGKLMDALALSDRFLRNGASDRLLQLLIERGEENHSTTGQGQNYGGHGIWSNSWQYCLRLKDKQLAARLALRYIHRWELGAALDILTMCSCHVPQSDPIRNEILHMRQALQRYNHILSADDYYSSWQQVELACTADPEGLALRLAEKGAVSAALEVAESAGLSRDLRRELQGQQLVKLLTADPLSGGGPAEASCFLSSLSDSKDALPVAMGAMQLLPNLRSKQHLVHFFLKRKDGHLSYVEVSRLNSWALGLRVLAALPLPWQQRCSSLHEYPALIVEVLLMGKQLQSVSQIFKEFPSLRDNAMIVTYAAKAVAVSVNSPSREVRTSVSRPKPKTRSGGVVKSSFSSSLSNLQKEARRAFSWGPRNGGEKGASKDNQRKRKNSGLFPSEKNAWEAMAGIQEDSIASFSTDGQERLPPVSIADEWMLTGDPIKDEAVRASHRYQTAPDITLFKALISLCTDEMVSARSAVDLCVNQMKNVLNSQQVPENSSMEMIGRAYRATETFVQGLFYAKSLLRKLGDTSELPVSSERNRDTDDTSSDAGSSSVGSQPTDELSELLLQADVWLGRAELLQSLLGSGIAVSVDDIADNESSERLCDRLTADERYSMAVYTCRKCKIDIFPVWNAWGHALLRMERYAQARVKFKQALQLYKADPAQVILEIINTIEGSPPVDVSAVRSMYEHLAKSAPAIMDDSLSTDSYLNVLYMPTTFPRSEGSRRSPVFSENSARSADYDDGPRSNLDSIRYLECVTYLQEYSRQHLLDFMFRHGRYHDACTLFFPPNAVPPPPQPSLYGVASSSSSSPQRPDPLASDYGTIDDLCDLCIGHGAMSILEEVISTRMSSTNPQDTVVYQHSLAALARICSYCEVHKHFNCLYKFQVIKKDHVAAGLCCIQLFMNSSTQDEAIKHLEKAKMHFDEGLSARHKGGDSTKLVTKGLRGKSASEKLSEEGFVKFTARIAIQMDVVKSFNDSEGPQWKHSLFGNPNDPETFRRRCEIAETLAEKNFDLAFQVIYEFNLPAVDIYAGVAALLAERKKGGQLTDFFRNIKGTIDDEDWDQVLGSAINVYANKHKERPDRLIDMLTSSHRKVLACVVCGRLKSAFQIASRSGSVADVQYVAHQALHANALPVLDMCKQWLAQCNF
ncbi:hypothetical protein SAY86_028752 [Trapa natans]|uniref:ZFYVE26-like TPR repeats domain-containing protein n=1 Tax=Trapa natans TaxID=22666 RepID=A0AAN7REM6_TRANT|nr:hypothetical protein SAY86_028752 [Trapa natans]